MIRPFARFKAINIELSQITVVVDYLPNKIGVRGQLFEQIEVYYSGVKPEPKSISICGYDSDYSIAWIEYSEREGTDSPMPRFVRDFNYKRFLGNVLTVSVVERGHVVRGHVDSSVPAPDFRYLARTSTPERHPPLSRTELLREVLPNVVPRGRTLGSKQIRHIARGENLCFTCLKPGHTRSECPTNSNVLTPSPRQVSKTRISGLKQVQNKQPKHHSRSFIDESWADPPPKFETTATHIPSFE